MPKNKILVYMRFTDDMIILYKEKATSIVALFRHNCRISYLKKVY